MSFLNKNLKKVFKKSDKNKKKPEYDPSKPLRTNIVSATSDKMLNEDLLVFRDKVNLLFGLNTKQILKSDIDLGALSQMKRLCMNKSDDFIVTKLSDKKYQKYFTDVKQRPKKVNELVLSSESLHSEKSYSDKIKTKTKGEPIYTSENYNNSSSTLIKNETTMDLIAKYKNLSEMLNTETYEAEDFEMEKEMGSAWSNYTGSSDGRGIKEAFEDTKDTKCTSSPAWNKSNEKNKVIVEKVFKKDSNIFDMERRSSVEKNRILVTDDVEELTKLKTESTGIFNAIKRFFIWLFSLCCDKKKDEVNLNHICRINILNALNYLKANAYNISYTKLPKEVHPKLHYLFFKTSNLKFNQYRLEDVLYTTKTILRDKVKGIFSYKTTKELFAMYEKYFTKIDDDSRTYLFGHLDQIKQFKFGILSDICEICVIARNSAYVNKEGYDVIMKIAITEIIFANVTFIPDGSIVKLEEKKKLYASPEKGLGVFDAIIDALT